MYNCTYIKTLIFSFQNGNTIKLLEIHVLNVNPVLEKIYQLVRPLLKKSLNDLVSKNQRNKKCKFLL